ncbi:MAG: tRNA lysidine(34) synthetase TilS [Pseudohaliea sp.]
MPDLNCPVTAALAAALDGREGRHWLVGFSGGLDSTALLLALAAWRSQHPGAPPLTALHVHHGLHPDADRWAAHCAGLCARLGVALETVRVAVEPGDSGPEAAARAARYAAFEAALGEGGCLFLAHHEDDQVETVLLRLLRGTGERGLAGMPVERPVGAGVLCRPFLALPRAALRDYVAARGERWIDDPSNDDPGPDRNYLRRVVLPALAARWPGYRATVSRSAANLAQGAREAPPTWHNAFGDPGVAVAELAGPGGAARLRAWLLAEGCEPGPRAPLQEFLRQLAAAAPAAAPRLVGPGWCLGRFGAAAWLLPRPEPFVAPAPRLLAPGDVLVVPGVGELRVAGPAKGAPPLLAFRRGGERLQLAGEPHRRRLKALLQDAAVPPWWRARLPLLIASDGRVLAAGERWRAEGSPWAVSWDRSAVARRDA